MFAIPSHVKAELKLGTPLQKGKKGVSVRRVQEWLSIHGFHCAIDGDFGDATEHAVKHFQDASHLHATGIVDEGTWVALTAPLQNVFKDPQLPAQTSLGEAILRVALIHLAEQPIEIGGDNKGPWVRTYMGGNEGPEWRWCAGFVTFVMKQACALLDVKVPIQGSYSCDSLAYQAKEAGRLVGGADLVSGAATWSSLGKSQVFLVRASASNWTHCGFAFEGDGSVFSTIEGNTNDDGSSNGYEVCARTRSLKSKDFIRF